MQQQGIGPAKAGAGFWPQTLRKSAGLACRDGTGHAFGALLRGGREPVRRARPVLHKRERKSRAIARETVGAHPVDVQNLAGSLGAV